MESKDVVRRILEEDGAILVSFQGHDGYFRVPDSADAAALKERLLQAQREKKQISFTFDRDLNILKINATGAGPLPV